MNERIQELYKQATIKDHWSIDEGRYLTDYLNEQKFAELIVLRCSELSDLAEKNCLHPGTIMKRHFGVEE